MSEAADEELPVELDVEEAKTEEPAPEPPAPPTVHILVERGPDGGVSVDVLATGDVRVTEIESILRLALKRWESKSGIG